VAAPRRGGDDNRCHAKNRRSVRCGNGSLPGQQVCRLHGGSSPQAKRKAAERVLEDQARKALDKLDIQPVDDPLEALSQLAGQILAWKDLLAERVKELQGKYRYETEFNEAIRGEVVLFERAMDRAVQVLAVIAKLNIDERLAAITERQAGMLENALFAAFEAYGFTLDDADHKQNVLTAFTAELAVIPDRVA
jgi:hypothetical protein